MISRTYFYVYSNNRRLCWILGLVFMAFFILTLLPEKTFHWLFHWDLSPAPRGYWNRFMPVAQFAAAASLAYLALELFRHSLHVEKLVREFFGTTHEDRKGVVDSIKGITLEDEDSNLQLLILMKLYRLSEIRTAWGRLLMATNNDDRKAELKSMRETLKRAQSEAERYTYLRDGTGKAFVKCFHRGQDTVTVLFGLALAVSIHILATLESFVQLFLFAPFESMWVQMLLLAIMAFSGIILPLWYVAVGRKLLDEIGEVADLAVEQFARMKLRLGDQDQERVDTTLRTLGDAKPERARPAAGAANQQK